MFTIAVTHEFCAAHSLTIAGTPEPSHGHNFRVRAEVSGELDSDGLLADFHTVHALLADICEPWSNRDLNAAEPFHRVNPSAEHIAKEIAERLEAGLGLAPVAWVSAVTVTEAPGCEATYRPHRPTP